jgi:hypothetical protein
LHGESILAYGVTHVRVRVARTEPRFAFEVPFLSADADRR